MARKKICSHWRDRVSIIPNRDELVLVRLCKCQRSGVAMPSLSFGWSVLLLVALRWLDNGSKSWVRPHENTNDDSEWMWVSNTMACTISDNDQLFGPLVNFCKRVEMRRQWCKQTILRANRAGARLRIVLIPQCAPCSASTDDALESYWYRRWHVVWQEYDRVPSANLDRRAARGIVACANSLDTCIDVLRPPICMQSTRGQKERNCDGLVSGGIGIVSQF